MPKSKGKIKKERLLHEELLKEMLKLSTSGFGLVAALAWNELIKETVTVYIKPYVGKGSGVTSLLIYAIAVTVLAVVVTYNLNRIVAKFKK
jgi:hypothetical protein